MSASRADNPAQSFGPLAAQGPHRGRRRRRHRHRRSRARPRRSTAERLHSRAKITPFEGTQRDGPAGAHAGARPLRAARPQAGDRGEGLGPAGRRHPADAGAGAAQHRPDAGRRLARDAAASRHDRRDVSRGIDRATPAITTRPFIELEGASITYGRGAKAVRGAVADLAADPRGRFRRAGRAVGLRQVDHPEAGRRPAQRPPPATSSSPGARSARRRSASAWPSRTRPCCPGSPSATT